jgi:serine phosphatase RsbU (regulator of sigma subunit)
MKSAEKNRLEEQTEDSAEGLTGIRPTDLPTPPQVAVKIMQASAGGIADAKKLATLVASDPVLTAELLRIVNSAFFGFQREIANLEHAVVILGQKVLRNLVLCISVRNALANDAIPDLDTDQFWEDAIRRSVSARLIASLLKEDKDEYFTIALLQDFGLLILFYIHQGKSQYWNELRTSDPDTRLEKEKHYFQDCHDRVGRLLFEKWEFPQEYWEAIGTHHVFSDSDSNTPADCLPKALYCADWINTVFTTTSKAPALERCRQLMSDLLDIGPDQSETLLNEVPDQVRDACRALGLEAKPQQDFEQILRETNVTLAEENLNYQELTWRLQKALDERDRLAAEMNQELELAREIQASLMPPSILGNFSVTGVNVPARQLSGDFYDYFTVKDGRVVFCLGDVSGKGTNAAILMAKTCSLFRCLGKHILDPRRLLAMINAEVCETSTRGMFVTMVAGIYDPKSGQVQMVNAGHLPALLVHGKERVNAYNSQALPLGIDPQSTFQAVDFRLDGGSLYMFSDGLTEALVNDEQLGLHGLIGLLVESSDCGPRKRIETVISRFVAGSVTPHDDLTLLLIDPSATRH